MFRFAAFPARALDSNLPPKDNFDLDHWKLQLPVNSSGELSGTTDAAEVSVTQLNNGLTNAYFNGFTNAYFYTGADGEMVFWAPVTGATTSGTTYPRSELREMLNTNNTSVNWKGYGAHALNVQCKVLQVPSSGKVIIGQIKGFTGNAYPLVKILYYNGTVQGIVKTNSSNDASDYKFPTVNVGLGNSINYQVQMVNGLITIAVSGSSGGVTNALNVFQTDPDWATNTLYFKAGDYCQDNGGTDTEGSRVAIYALAASHAPGITNQPASRWVAAGTNATFSVGAIGNGTLSYQWWFKATNKLNQATKASLTVTNVAGTNVGNYTVAVSDSFGSVTSAVATLAITVPPVITNLSLSAGPSAFTLAGTGGTNQPYVLLTAASLKPPVTWTPIATNSAGANGGFSFTDSQAASFTQRFYRVTTP
jgi:hypothetical protein